MSYSSSTLARPVLSLVLRLRHPYSTFSSSTLSPTQPANAIQPTQAVQAAHDPFQVTIPTTPLGLPIHPIPSPLPDIQPNYLSSDTLLKLHRLSALNPPTAGSDEERNLIEDLSGLIGLMDLVKEVEIPADLKIEDLLGRGGEVVIKLDPSENVEKLDHLDGKQQATEEGKGKVDGGKKDRDLLGWATRRIGDYYASKVEKKA